MTGQPPRICAFCEKRFKIKWWMFPDQTVCSPECQFKLKQRMIDQKNQELVERTRRSNLKTAARKAAGLPPGPRGPSQAQLREAAIARERQEMLARRAKAFKKRLPGISEGMARWLAEDC